MAEKVFHELAEKLTRNMNIGMVFGEPVEVKDKLIIPVSKTMGCFGGGEGNAPGVCSKEDDKDSENAQGSGGGGMLKNTALGVFEISDESTRFIPAIQTKHILIMAGMFFYFILRLVKRKKRKR